MITIQASVGEVLDKISILVLKKENLEKPEAVENVSKELDALYSAISSLQMEESLSHPLFGALAEVNRKLWVVEDDLRELESKRTFNSDFIELARSVYRLNDRRAAIKRELNVIYGSALVEEKSYQPY